MEKKLSWKVMEKSWKLKKINKVMETGKIVKKVMEFVRVANIKKYVSSFRATPRRPLRQPHMPQSKKHVRTH